MATVDTSIYNAFSQPLKSISDYDNERLAKQRNAFALQVDQQKADEYTRKVERENALRSFQQGLIGKSRSEQADALIKAGWGPEGFALQDQDLKWRKGEAEIKNIEADWRTKNAPFVKRDAAVIMQDPRPETIDAILTKHEKETGQSMQAAREQYARANGDPDAIRRIASGHSMDAEKLLPKSDTVDYGGGVARQAIDPVTGRILSTQTVEKTQSPDNRATNETSRMNNAASVSATMRGQDISRSTSLEVAGMADKREREKAVEPKPLTEGQAKAVQFASRMETSGAIIDDLASKGTSVSTPGARSGFGLGASISAIQPAEKQRLDQAKRDFINAVLRRESGAVISQEEFDNAEKQYFPQVNEDKSVAEQKRQNRMTALAGIKIDIPPAYGEKYKEIVNSAKPQPASPGPQPAPQPGQVLKGYRFRGGDPSSQASWEKV